MIFVFWDVSVFLVCPSRAEIGPPFSPPPTLCPELSRPGRLSPVYSLVRPDSETFVLLSRRRVSRPSRFHSVKSSRLFFPSRSRSRELHSLVELPPLTLHSTATLVCRRRRLWQTTPVRALPLFNFRTNPLTFRPFFWFDFVLHSLATRPGPRPP